MGRTGYYRKVIEGFSKNMNPITSLEEKEKIFVWDQKCGESFNRLKKWLTTTPILKIEDLEKYIIVCIDGCN